MEKLTYKQAYDKIIEAYFKDQIEPYNGNFCFCGTLCGDSSWMQLYGFDGRYERDEYKDMEWGLLITISKEMAPSIKEMENNIYANYSGSKNSNEIREELLHHPEYENALFKGMCAALEVLKQIHKERGEDVDGVQEFKKRELVK